MSEPAPKPDTIDEANAKFWKPRTLDELMAGVPSWSPGISSTFPT